MSTKDEHKSRLTSAVTRCAQSGYRQRLDTSDYGELLLEQCSPKCPRVSLRMPFQFLPEVPSV